MARVISLAIDLNINIVSFKGGGAVNTIPRECTLRVIVPNNNCDNFREIINREFNIIKDELQPIEPNVSLSIENVQSCDTCYDSYSTQKILDVISLSPNGAIRMNPYLPEETQTSISLSVIGLEENKLYIHFFARSDSLNQLKEVKRCLECLSRQTGCTISNAFNEFPGWEPNPNSSIFVTLKESYDQLKLYPTPPRVYSVHAGLECGLIIGRYPDMQCVSIGPLITNAHTPDEALHVETTAPFYAILKNTISSFAVNNQKL